MKGEVAYLTATSPLAKMFQISSAADLFNPSLHTDDIWHLLLQTALENSAIKLKGEIA